MTSKPEDSRDISSGRSLATIRRPHHKSKLGCKACKKRRIKCDQRCPCANCIKRGVDCSLLTLHPSTPWSRSSTVHVFHQNLEIPRDSNLRSLPVPSFFDTLTQNGLLHDVPDVLQPQIKRILHHLCSATIETISPTPQARAALPLALPKLVIEHPYVLKGYLSMASLHLSRLHTTDHGKKYHATLATGQLNTALPQYRTALQNITPQNAEALFAFSTSISTYSLATTGAECKTLLSTITPTSPTTHLQTTTSTLINTISTLFHTLRGVLVILVPSWHQLRDGPLASLIECDWWPDAVPTSPHAIQEGLRIQALERMWMKPGRGYEYCFNTLAAALKQLRDNFALVSRLTVSPTGSEPESHDPLASGVIVDHTAVMVWPILVSAEFVVLLEGRRHEAWAIIAHYAILLHRATRGKRVWWLEGVAAGLVATAGLVLGEENGRWIEWPVGEIGLGFGGAEGAESS